MEDALRSAEQRLRVAGIPSPRVDAELLAAHLLGVSRGRLRALVLTGAEVPEGFEALVEQRAGRVPLQHLTGTATFRRVDLAVGPGVFVPRPETESVAQLAIDRAVQLDAPRIVDLGTGSGAIAAAIADEVPGAEVHAVELSELALAWAGRNLASSGVQLTQGDLATALPEQGGSFDVVVSNPPYIPPDAVPVDPEVADHDPHLALYGGGADGLDLPRAAARTAARLLKPGGYFVMEHAEVQAPAVAAFLAGTGSWEAVTTHQDLTGRDRATSAVRISERPGGSTTNGAGR
ncbi:peptide chain release factor N(5)-glutamine methyltransferase [Arthrobacter echini]|uniref:Release factor glutamine methyltransferase n=1 Tax=Arthrobacter echini TaxID=1529066 RepID=A0A5D0XTZ6_9MICC|nr:peptide chain release factor N(5)-glutamine methyltransferase [Arthrobacter echini]TYC99648.1 peptide chain release factor N(5)-glutamine methyltransferase [Arthrobacter echini]